MLNQVSTAQLDLLLDDVPHDVLMGLMEDDLLPSNCSAPSAPCLPESEAEHLAGLAVPGTHASPAPHAATGPVGPVSEQIGDLSESGSMPGPGCPITTPARLTAPEGVNR